jgi:hypothetical protein
MRLTIIPDDSSVYKDGVMKAEGVPALDLTVCGIPTSVRALQWYDTYGEIEFSAPSPGAPRPPNQPITELPQWALNCVAVWDAWSPPAPSLPQESPEGVQP